MIQASVPKLQTTNDKGFTLIELLVVIAIIGLLAVIVMAGLQDARERARNSKKNQTVDQYVNALELSKDANGLYPQHGNSTGNYASSNFACIGYETSETCFGAYGISGNSTVNDSLDEKFGTDYEENTTVNAGVLGNMRGILYACSTSSNCYQYELRWALEGTNKDCGKGSTNNSDFFGVTICELVN